MVTIKNLTTTFTGLSTDTKPTDCRNGDLFMEMDTQTSYLYDGENQTWIEQSGGGSGGGGGSSLPSVTTADNGKVLTVVEGAWDKADASGGGDDKLFVITAISDGMGSATIDKTYTEIEDALANDKIPVVCFKYTSSAHFTEIYHFDEYIANPLDRFLFSHHSYFEDLDEGTYSYDIKYLMVLNNNSVVLKTKRLS